MGFAISVSSVILLLAILVSASMIYSTHSTMQKIVMRGERMGAEVEYEQIHTIIKIKNVSYANGYLNIFVENNGSVAISVDGIDVLLDGQIRTQSIVSTTVDGENVSIWLPRETLIINLSVTSVPNRVKVVTHNGVSAYW